MKIYKHHKFSINFKKLIYKYFDIREFYDSSYKRCIKLSNGIKIRSDGKLIYKDMTKYINKYEISENLLILKNDNKEIIKIPYNN